MNYIDKRITRKINILDKKLDTDQKIIVDDIIKKDVQVKIIQETIYLRVL